MVLKVTSIISFIISMLLIGVFLGCKKRYIREYSEYDFVKDKLIVKEWLAGNYNFLFYTSGEIAKVINKYIISYKKRKCYLISNYVKQFNNISMTVFVYNKSEKLTHVVDINETSPLSHSSVIKLPSSCSYVNIIINSVDTSPVMESKNLKNYKKLVKIETLALFFSLFPASYITLNVISANAVNDNIKDILILISIVPNIWICIINYKIISKLFVLTKSANLGDYKNE